MRSVRGGLALFLAFFAAFFLAPTSAQALAGCIGSSICSPANAPLLAEFAATSPTLTTAGMVSGSFTGASAGAPIAAIGMTSAATTAGASTSVWGTVATAAVALLGGMGVWGFKVPDSESPGLPAGSGGWSGTFPAYGPVGSGVDARNHFGGSYSITKTGDTSYSVTLDHFGGTGYYYGAAAVAVSARLITSTGCSASVSGMWPYYSKGDVSGGQTFNFSTGGSAGGTCSYATYTGIQIGYFYYRGSSGNWFKENDAAGYASASVQLVGGSPTPSRYIEQTITCKNAAGTLSTFSQSTVPGSMEAGQIVEVAGIMCPSGSRLVGVEATVKTEGGDDLDVLTHPYVEGEGLDLKTETIPETCYTTGATCELRLERATSPAQDTWATVEANPNWWSDPARDLNYRCRYGSDAAGWITVPIVNCSVYDIPEGGEMRDPTPADDPYNPDSGGNCSFGWTDIFTGKVFIEGSKCVLRWAFIPSDGFFESKITQVDDAWATTAPVVTVTAVGDAWGPWLVQPTDPNPDCLGPSFEIVEWGWEDLHPFSACGPIAQQVVPIAKPLLAAVVLIAAVTGAAAQLSSSIGLTYIGKGKFP